MTLLNRLFKILRFPLDLILLTVYYLIGLIWLLYFTIRSSLGSRPDKKWIFGCFTKMLPNGDYACLPGRYFANPRMFACLCPDHVREPGSCVNYCRANLQRLHDCWKPSWLRLFGVGAGLTLVWSGILVAATEIRTRAAVTPEHISANQLDSADRMFAAGRWRDALAVYQEIERSDTGTAGLHYNIGECLLRLERPDEARQHFEHAVHVDPALRDAHLKLSRLALEGRQWYQAARFAETAHRLNPSEPDALLIVAECHFREKNVTDARLTLDQAVAMPVTHFYYFDQAGDLYLKLNALEEAERCYRQSLELNSESVAAQVGLATVAIARREFDAGSAILNRVLPRQPDNIQAHLLKAKLKEMTGDVHAASQLYDQLLLRFPANPDVRFSKIALLVKNDDIDQASKLLVDLTSQFPEHYDSAILLAKIYNRKGMYSFAIETVQDIVERSPADIHALKVLANANMGQERFERAIEIADEILASDPSDLDVLLIKLDAWHYLGNDGMAIETGLATALSHPQAAQVDRKLGDLYYRTGEVASALKWYQSALQKNPNPVTANNVGMILLATGEPGNVTEAIRILSAVRRQFPNSSVINDSLGWAYYHGGDLTNAEDMLRRSIYLQRESPEIWYHLGKVLYESKKYGDATLALRQALKLSESFDGRADSLRLLRNMKKSVHDTE